MHTANHDFPSVSQIRRLAPRCQVSWSRSPRCKPAPKPPCISCEDSGLGLGGRGAAGMGRFSPDTPLGVVPPPQPSWKADFPVGQICRVHSYAPRYQMTRGGGTPDASHVSTASSPTAASTTALTAETDGGSVWGQMGNLGPARRLPRMPWGFLQVGDPGGEDTGGAEPSASSPSPTKREQSSRKI